MRFSLAMQPLSECATMVQSDRGGINWLLLADGRTKNNLPLGMSDNRLVKIHFFLPMFNPVEPLPDDSARVAFRAPP
jgi:hypothetical protein